MKFSLPEPECCSFLHRTLSSFLSTGVVVAVTMTALPFRVGPLSFAGLVIFLLLSLPLVTSQTPSLPATSDPESVPSLPEECRRKMHPVTSYTGGCKIPCSLLPFPSSHLKPKVKTISLWMIFFLSISVILVELVETSCESYIAKHPHCS